MKYKILTESDIKPLFQQLANRIKMQPGNKIFGIPRGGVPVAYRLLSLLPSYSLVNTSKTADIIVDDIIDSGVTKERYTSLKRVYFDTLIKADGIHWFVFPWEQTPELSAEDIPLRFLQYINENPKRVGLTDTPKRVIRSWAELYSGYQTDAVKVLGTVFPNDKYNEMIILKDIEFYSTCEHHLLPFFGKVHIAYIPDKTIIGISKLARLVECFSRRLQIQENLTQQIADTINRVLTPLGVGVLIQAQHLCMLARGVSKQSSVMKTSVLHGVLKKESAARSEFLQLIS